MKKKKACDFTLMISILLLTFIGVIMVFSSSWPDGLDKMGNGYFYLKKQLVAAILGFGAMIFFMNFDYKNLYKLSRIIFAIAVVSGLLIITPLGTTLGTTAKRWVNLGFTTFMPSDVIKLGSIIFFAAFLSKRKENIQDFKKGFIPSMIIVGFVCGLIIIQKDLGTTATLAFTLVIMFFVSGAKIQHLSMVGVSGTIALALAIIQPFADAGERYRIKRVTTFLDPFKDIQGDGWQVVQSLYALGSGGLFGLGLGKSRQKFFYIPEPYNDFIFAIIGEELGFLGCATVILLYALVIWRGIKIALNAKDFFGCILATGITTLITVQSLIHMAVVTSSMPTTGIPLPFISYGGTSLMTYMAIAGILLNISRHTELDRS
ncbi:stage V sporulation protein E [Gottschalkia acidurici 9a]|uniref:Probable peptidoglycan glycosyltransferase FtsW n=1 Tax=Gottschalkia acidurici (strain ATCC 7906 / DSM 604 / BCRC 14475 / CIP 104303 / KCTC 5404 / NCIMB 10678 / 9a) TaxID=1128398 RepID=K0B0Y9_GOTA9|nr:putative lipid II flippase FtsW [Gottschalkia acidurici]AFS78311.1 stage V sporulation protein E [Gottschalkia acidurici 9a]